MADDEDVEHDPPRWIAALYSVDPEMGKRVMLASSALLAAAHRETDEAYEFILAALAAIHGISQIAPAEGKYRMEIGRAMMVAFAEALNGMGIEPGALIEEMYPGRPQA